MKKLIVTIYFTITCTIIVEAQNVGIGIASPQSDLHLHSATSSSSTLQLTNNITTGANSRGASMRMLGGNLYLQNHETSGNVYVEANGLPSLAITNQIFSETPTNFIGLGTILPKLQLHIHDNTLPDASINITNQITSDGQSKGARLRMLSNDFHIINYQPTGEMSFSTNLNKRMTILPNGNIGIGTFLPATQFHVNSTNAEAFRLQGPTAYQTFYDNDNYRGYVQAWTDGLGIGVTPGHSLKFYTQTDAERMVILENGNVGIGTTNPTVPFQIVKTVNDASMHTMDVINTGTGSGIYSKIGNGTSALFFEPIAIRGEAGINGIGVVGFSNSGVGTYGYSESGYGVIASSINGTGIYASGGSVDKTAIEINGAIKVSGNKSVFRHEASVANISANSTTIPNTTFANSATDLLIVTPFWDGVYVNSPLGVFFNNNEWHIFRQDLQPMPVDAKFNVMVVKQ